MRAGAGQVGNLPGRPGRDPSDSAWPAVCFGRGAVTACFVPAPGFRLHARARRDLTGDRMREKNRAGKVPGPAAVKLPGVVSGLHGVTGRDIMDRLIAGERDPRALAQLARARARRKIGELEQALEGAGFFTDAHAALLRSRLDRIEVINAGIGRLSAVIGELPAPEEEQLQQAEPVPGRGRRSAGDAVAGTGADMSRFAAPGHLASRAGRTPLDKQSGKRAGQAKHKTGNRYLGAVTGEAAVSAGKTGTREGARYRRLARGRGKAKACVALGSTQMRACRKLLSAPGARWEDPGPDCYDRQRNLARQVSHHTGKLSEPGYRVTLEPFGPQTGELLTTAG